MHIFWEMRQQNQIAQAVGQASSARTTVRTLRDDVVRLNRQCDKSMLICEALWKLLQDKLGVEEDEFLKLITQIDLTDGQLDGRVRRPPAVCPACERTNPQRMTNCMYCGHEMEVDPFAS